MGEKDVLDYLDSVAGIWGFDVVSRAGIVTPPGTTPGQAQENDRKLETAARAFFRALAEGRERRPGLRSVIIFHGQRATFDELADAFPADHAYWNEQGWLDPGARYYNERPGEPALRRRGEHRGMGRQAEAPKGPCRDALTSRASGPAAVVRMKNQRSDRPRGGYTPPAASPCPGRWRSEKDPSGPPSAHTDS